MSTNIRAIGFSSALLLLGLPLACSEPQTAAQKNDKARNEAIAELADATKVVQDFAADTGISPSTRGKARCVVVVPSLGKGAFIVGASHGSGVVTCRTTSGWSGPAFVTMSGASVGLQAGGQSSDLLMFVNTDKAVSKLFTGNLKLGADASVAAGPVGGGASAANETSTNAEILTYAHSKGAFAGVDVSGMGVSYNMEAANALYGPTSDTHMILTGAVAAPPEAAAFLDAIRHAIPNMGSPPVAAM